jgi:hypothetical protein
MKKKLIENAGMLTLLLVIAFIVTLFASCKKETVEFCDKARLINLNTDSSSYGFDYSGYFKENNGDTSRFTYWSLYELTECELIKRLK